MVSIPPEISSKIASDVAFKLGLPWRVEELRKEAEEACQSARLPSESLGLPREKAYERRMLEGILEQVKKAGEEMERDRRDLGQGKPTREQIETALGTFTAKEWEIILKDLDQVGVEALLSFIHQDADRLKQKLGAREVGCIQERANMREYVLWVENNRSTAVPITDPYWANVFREEARQANLKREGHPAKGVSVSERASYRNIARRLSKRDEQIGRDMNVSPYEVKQWLEREGQRSFEQYVADVGADDEEKRAVAFSDYYTMIRRKHQRKRD